MLQEVIPPFGKELDKVFHNAWRDETLLYVKIPEVVHAKGINIRHLGRIRKRTCNIFARTFLLIEMVVRVVKCEVRYQLRQRARELRNPFEEPFKRLVIDILNRVLATTPESDHYWNTTIKKKIVTKFPEALSEEEMRDNYPIKDVVMGLKIRSPRKSMSEIQTPVVFAELGRTLLIHERISELEGKSLQFHIKESNVNHHWIVECNELNPSISRGKREDADCSVSMDKGDFDAFVTHSLELQDGINQKKIRVTGDSELLRVLAPLMIKPPFYLTDETLISDGRYILFQHFKQTLGLVFKSPTFSPDKYPQSSLFSLLKSVAPLQSLDLAELEPKVKLMNIVSSAEVITVIPN